MKTKRGDYREMVLLSSSASVSAEIPPTLSASVGHVEEKISPCPSKSDSVVWNVGHLDAELLNNFFPDSPLKSEKIYFGIAGVPPANVEIK